MDEEMTGQLAATAQRLAAAAETLDRVLGRLDSQQEALNAKVDRIVAAVEERGGEVEDPRPLQARMAELEKSNQDLKAQAARLSRKTLPALVTALLGKTGNDAEHFDRAGLDKSLQALSVEQRIAVKAEMARAGMSE
jgi:predicted RNase H-like nuclease (RuvC/YqgF family)